MTKVMQSITAVIFTTMIGGALGGFVGRLVGQFSPSFVRALAAPAGPNASLPSTFRPDEFGLGLGIVSGLFFGAGTGLFVVLVAAVREVLVARSEMAKRSAMAMREV